MPVAPNGTVYLDSVQFTTDPQVYQPLQWKKRATVHKGIQGAVTVQDFGTFAKDNILYLASGPSGFMEKSVVATLHTKYRTKGATYSLTDWFGNSFTVFIEDFDPEPARMRTLFRYTMTLQVLGITTLLGTAYTGS